MPMARRRHHDDELLRAVIARDGDGVDRCLALGASPDARTPERDPVLVVACRLGLHDIVRRLLRHGADVRRVGKEGWTALHWAARNGDLRLMEVLVGSGADIMAANDKGSTPLHLAAWQGHVQAVIWLIRAGANLQVRDRSGRSPMDLARGGCRAVLAALFPLENCGSEERAPAAGPLATPSGPANHGIPSPPAR